MSKSMKRGRFGDGTLDQRGPDVWRLRYRVAGRRVTQTYRGTKRDAQKELRRLIRANDAGEAVLPDKITLGEWIKRWLAAGAPGRRQKQISRRSLERYEEMLRVHVVPVLGDRPLQQLRADEIDALYLKLKSRISERTIFFVHVILGAAIGAAVRQRVLPTSPMQYLGKVPSAPESDHGMALDPGQARKLVAGFRGHPLYLLVVTALATGMRRNELLALRWVDVDAVAKTLRIERCLERTRGNSAIKAPKTRRGVRTIAIDDELLGLLLAERERHLSIEAGISDGASVDLRLIKLPEEALVFPGTPREGGFSFTAFRHPSGVTKIFSKVARKLGFPKLRFHDLRGTAITRMLTAGIPSHVVAKRHGHDPATMLRAYAKALPQDDAQAAAVMAEMLKGAL
jgi:integrase